MSFINSFFLKLIHFIYAVAIALRSFWKRQTTNSPLPIDAPRNRIPKHLALLFVIDSSSYTDQVERALIESVLNVVEWCRAAGIDKLTVYDESGHIASCSQRIYDAIPTQSQECSSESEIEYPLTPPPSDYSESRSLSPQRQDKTFIPSVVLRIPASSSRKPSRRSTRRRTRKKKRVSESSNCHSQKPISICLISREASKPSIASAARYLVQMYQSSQCTDRKPLFQLSISDLDNLLENEETVSSPDFMIIHDIDPTRGSPAGELHGFPPWHIRLTELYYTVGYPKTNSWVKRICRRNNNKLDAVSLDEETFREALDEFAGAEMRFGK